MSKKGGGFWDNLLLGMFDNNRDGRMDLGEQWLAFKIFEECTKDDTEEDTGYYDFSYYGLDNECEFEDASWREFCEDGSEYGLYPEFFETEEEYLEALAEAQQNSIEEALEIQVEVEESEELQEEDFQNKRRYDAAEILMNKKLIFCSEKEKESIIECCRFIVEQADFIPAANYLSYDGGFLFAQAIKENFALPISLPEEETYRRMSLYEILGKIAKRDIPLSFRVWEWCLETFLPYEQYDVDAVLQLTTLVLEGSYVFPTNYEREMVRYMDMHPDFMKKVMRDDAELSSELDEIIYCAMDEGLRNIALALFQAGLKQAGTEWEDINTLVSGLVFLVTNSEKREMVEYFQREMFPIIKKIDIGMVQDEIEEWEKELDECLQ